MIFPPYIHAINSWQNTAGTTEWLSDVGKSVCGRWERLKPDGAKRLVSAFWPLHHRYDIFFFQGFLKPSDLAPFLRTQNICRHERWLCINRSHARQPPARTSEQLAGKESKARAINILEFSSSFKPSKTSFYHKVDIQVKTKLHAQKHSIWSIIFSLFFLWC